MKIGVSTYSFEKYVVQNKCDYFKLCDLAKELGFEGIEFIHLDWQELSDNPMQTAGELREYCKKIGLEIIAYTVGANFLADDVQAEMQKLKEHVDIAAALGAPIMRHDVLYELRDKPLYNYRTAIAEIAPLVRELTEYAQEKGVRTCSENHGFVMQDPRRVEELILAVGHENYGWLCDMGNFLCADADPAAAVAIAARYACHVHAKDFLFKAGTQPRPSGFTITTNAGNYLRGTVIGHGVVPIGNCVNALKKAGYDGWVSVEFEGAEENIQALKDGLENLRKIIRERE